MEHVTKETYKWDIHKHWTCRSQNRRETCTIFVWWFSFIFYAQGLNQVLIKLIVSVFKDVTHIVYRVMARGGGASLHTQKHWHDTFTKIHKFIKHETNYFKNSKFKISQQHQNCILQEAVNYWELTLRRVLLLSTWTGRATGKTYPGLSWWWWIAWLNTDPSSHSSFTLLYQTRKKSHKTHNTPTHERDANTATVGCSHGQTWDAAECAAWRMATGSSTGLDWRREEVEVSWDFFFF